MTTQRTASRGTIVLVVEDEGIIRMMLVSELEDAGFAVIAARNADTAITAISDCSNITVVVLDIQMHGSIDGLGLAAWMREHAPSVPIVVATAFVELPEIVAVNPAITRIVAKPYKPQQIIAAVCEVGTRPLSSPQ